MIVSALCVLGLAQVQPNLQAGRLELSERLKRLDVAWMATKDPARRREALTPINTAVAGFFRGRNSEVAEALDVAAATLEGRRVRPSDALNIRPQRPISEPGATLALKITWAYRPGSILPIRVGVGNQEVEVRPGSEATLNVNPWLVNPELRQNQEVGFLMPVRVGMDTRYVYVSFVRRLDERLQRLAGSSNPLVTDITGAVRGFQANPATMETELPLVQWIYQAESIEEGKTKASDIDQVHYARQGSTVFRAAFPKNRQDGPVNVVIAVHGAGGSENMFFESYGRGAAVSEALKRGWAFVAPRAGASAIDDSLEWLTTVRGMKLGKVFLMGHSMGGGVVVSASPKVRPTGYAVFAPAAARLGPVASELPVFLAVGKQEQMAMMSSTIAKANEGRAGFVFREYDPCEHLMIVADAVGDAYRFFDGL
jgi:dienelactone hydrolase